MKRFILLAASLTLFVVFTNAQTSTYVTEKIPVNITVENSPTIVKITSPESLVEKSRGFKTVEGTSLTIVGTVQDADNVSYMKINNDIVMVAMNGGFRHTIPLNPGENIIKFTVTDGKDNVHEETRTVKTDVLAAKTTFDAALGSEVGTYYALIIGVDDYMDPEIVDLDNPVTDAQALKKVLQEQYVFEAGNIDYIENATRAQINDAMDALARKVKPNDNVLIFYAGHGYWDEQAEIGYWIPADGRKRSTADWYRNSTLTDQISAIKSKHTLLIADACFSGGIFKARAAFMDASLAINKKYELNSRKAMTSGTLTEVPDRSAFLKYLVRRLEANTQKYLSVSTLFYSFEEAVINNSDVRPQYGTIQKVGDEGGEFIFIRKD